MSCKGNPSPIQSCWLLAALEVTCCVAIGYHPTHSSRCLGHFITCLCTKMQYDDIWWYMMYIFIYTHICISTHHRLHDMYTLFACECDVVIWKTRYLCWWSHASRHTHLLLDAARSRTPPPWRRSWNHQHGAAHLLSSDFPAVMLESKNGPVGQGRWATVNHINEAYHWCLMGLMISIDNQQWTNSKRWRVYCWWLTIAGWMPWAVVKPPCFVRGVSG